MTFKEIDQMIEDDREKEVMEYIKDNPKAGMYYIKKKNLDIQLTMADIEIMTIILAKAVSDAKLHEN